MANEVTVDYSKFNVNHLTFTKVEENNRSKGQLIAYPRYDPTDTGKEGALFLQSPWLKLFTYGVPREGEYYKTDADRSHLRVPFDMSIPEVAAFVAKMKEIDEKFGSPEMMETMLGKKAKKYKYQSIFREGQDQTTNESDDEDGEKDTKAKVSPPRPPYMKIKLDMTWPDNEVKTQVFTSVLDQSSNKRLRTKVENIRTIDDFANVVRYLSNVRLMFRPVKFWAHQLTKKDPQCGIVFKLLKVEVEPNKSSNSMYKQIYESDNFIDDDDDEPLPKIDVSAPVVLKQTKVTNDNDSDEESDDEPVITKKATIVEVESDSDDSDEEPDEEPIAQQKNAKGKKPTVTTQSKAKKTK
jgi:hypothetical protein